MINQEPSQSPESVPQVSQKAIESSLPGAPTILKEAFSVCKNRFGVFLGIMAIPVFLEITLDIFSRGDILNKVNTFVYVLISIIIFVLSVVLSTWSQIALFCAIRDREEKIGIKEAFARSWGKILSLWWVGFLSGIIILGGFLLFIIPGIIFSGWFSLAFIILIAENQKGMNALLKSREYIRGKWWSVFWRTIFLSLLIFIFLVIPLAVFSVLQMKTAGKIVGWAGAMIFTPLAAAYLFLIYQHLKEIKGEFIFTPTKGNKAKFVIVGVIGMLVVPIIIISIVFASLNSAKSRTRDTIRAADIRQITAAADMYYGDYGNYPDSLDKLSKYLTVPVDPKTKLPYEYQLQPGGQDYKICAKMENKTEECLTSQVSY